MKKNESLALTIEQKISSLSLDRKDLKKLIDILSVKASEAGELEIKDLEKLEQHSSEEHANLVKTLKDCFTLRLVVKDEDRDQKNLIGPAEELLKSADFPEEIKSVYIECGLTLKNVYNIAPKHSFKIFLDFSKPKIFDLSFLPSQGTPNESNISVQGLNSTWVRGVSSEVLSFIEKWHSNFSKVHNHSVYDFFLWILGFPFAFWICHKTSTFISRLTQSGLEEVLKIALYVYIFWGALFLFRILFHYLRWVCPLVEYKSKNNSIVKHRVFLTTLVLGTFSGLIKDFAQTIIHFIVN